MTAQRRFHDPEEDFSGDEDFAAELTDPGYLDEGSEVTVEELSGEEYLLGDDVYGDGAYPTDDDLMGDGWAEAPDTSLPGVDWRSAENADWDV